MKVKSDYESPLVLEKIEISESTFRKKDVSLEGIELSVYVEHNKRIWTSLKKMPLQLCSLT